MAAKNQKPEYFPLSKRNYIHLIKFSPKRWNKNEGETSIDQFLLCFFSQLQLNPKEWNFQ